MWLSGIKLKSIGKRCSSIWNSTLLIQLSMKYQEAASLPWLVETSACHKRVGNSRSTRVGTLPGAVCPTCLRRAEEPRPDRANSDQFCLRRVLEAVLSLREACTPVLRTCQELSRQQVEGSIAGLAPGQIKWTNRCSTWCEEPISCHRTSMAPSQASTTHHLRETGRNSRLQVRTSCPHPSKIIIWINLLLSLRCTIEATTVLGAIQGRDSSSFQWALGRSLGRPGIISLSRSTRKLCKICHRNTLKPWTAAITRTSLRLTLAVALNRQNSVGQKDSLPEDRMSSCILRSTPSSAARVVQSNDLPQMSNSPTNRTMWGRWRFLCERTSKIAKDRTKSSKLPYHWMRSMRDSLS